MTKKKQINDAELLHNLMVKAMSGGHNAMPFFKSSKNQTASTATTPAQTPRSSMQEQRAKPHKMTQEEALEKLMRVTMGDAAAGPYIR
ncbi:hypothetical protein CPC16_009170 [Podila verticillata]|nr:hypothetical protein CPC16_009170 [Podila verticillata]